MPEQTYDYSREFSQPAHKVWSFLTESEKLARWLLPNDFALEGNRAFRLWSTPTENWDGVLYGTVKGYVEGKMLSYELTTSSASQTSTVQWTLQESAGQTVLRLIHTGAAPLIETIYKAINGTPVSGHQHFASQNHVTLPHMCAQHTSVLEGMCADLLEQTALPLVAGR